MESCSGKVRMVIERYLDRLLEPQVIGEASPAQITKTLEMLLENGAGALRYAGELREEDPVSRGLRELAREMERETDKRE